MLNPPGFHSTASMVAEVDNTKFSSTRYPQAFVHISDCDRKISLEFSVHGDEDQHVADLHKVDTMIDLLRKFRRGLVVEHKRACDR